MVTKKCGTCYCSAVLACATFSCDWSITLGIITAEHWTHTVKDSSGVCNYLLGIFCQECVQDVVNSFTYPPYFFAICGVVCVEQAHSSSGSWEDIFITHLIIIIRLEVSIFPIVVMFFHGWCVPEVIVPSYAVGSDIYPGMAGFILFYSCAVLLCAQIIEFIVSRWSYSFVCTLHCLIIIIMQTYLKVLNL